MRVPLLSITNATRTFAGLQPVSLYISWCSFFTLFPFVLATSPDATLQKSPFSIALTCALFDAAMLLHWKVAVFKRDGARLAVLSAFSPR